MYRVLSVLLGIVLLAAVASAQDEGPVHSVICRGLSIQGANLAELALTGASVSSTVFRVENGVPVQAETNTFASICDPGTNTLTYHACKDSGVHTGYITCSNGCNSDFTACSVEDTPKSLVCIKTARGIEITDSDGNSVYTLNSKTVGGSDIEYYCNGDRITAINSNVGREMKFFSTGFMAAGSSSLTLAFVGIIIILVSAISAFGFLTHKQKSLQKKLVKKKRK